MKQPSLASTGFDETIDLDERWASLVGIHGGYMTAIAVAGAERMVPGRIARTISTNFQRVAQPGSATLAVDVQRNGRSLSTVLFEIAQDGRTANIGRITLTDPAPDGVEWFPPVLIDLPPVDECADIHQLVTVGHFQNADARLDPSSLPFSNGDRAMVRGHVRPLEPAPIDGAWLSMMSDWFPPPAFVRTEPPTGGVSIDLTTHIHRTLGPLDDGEWLRAEFELTHSTGGLATEHGRIATADGTLLAESVQTRWTVR